MKTNSHSVFLFMSIMLMFMFFTSVESLAQGDDAYTRPSLMHLDTLCAVLVDVDEDLTEYVQGERLRTIVELELRKTGISIVQDSHARPYLTLSLTAVPIRSYEGEVTNFAVSILCTLNQGVRLTRDLGIFSVASTWSTNYAANLGTKTARQGAEEIARSITESFLNAYLAVNPKR